MISGRMATEAMCGLGGDCRISVVFSGALGDTILLKPMFDEFRRRLPRCRITIVTSASTGKLFEALGWAESAADINLFDHHRWFGDEPRDTPPPWAECDWLVSGVSNGHDVWARHARRFCPSGRVSFFNPLPKPGDSSHVVTQRCRQLGLTIELELITADDPLVGWRRSAERTILIHPGSGGKAKCRPLIQYVLLARRLRSQGYETEFILGPVECEQIPVEAQAELAAEFRVVRSDNLLHLAELLRSARVFYGNDSGVSHLAAALGAPTVAVFISSQPCWWHPIGPRVWILAARQVLVSSQAGMIRSCR